MAQNRIGICYEYGYGVQMNMKAAAEWYQTAANNGSATALANLANLYNYGAGVKKDDKKAFELNKRAAELGDGLGQVQLAYCYFDGTGTNKDANMAFYWMQKAVDNGVDGAKELLELMRNIHNYDMMYPGESVGGGKTVFMEERNGIYYVSCKINGVPAKFIFDTGASKISLSAGFAQELLDKGLLSDNDVLGEGKVSIADGSTSSVIVVNIRDVEIGGFHLSNVQATITEQQNAPLLLGQSAIQQLGRVTIDGYKLIIHNDR